MKEGEKDRIVRHKRESGKRAIALEEKIFEAKEEERFRRREKYNLNSNIRNG